jgi:type IV secretory pathway VirB10-like protein
LNLELNIAIQILLVKYIIFHATQTMTQTETETETDTETQTETETKTKTQTETQTQTKTDPQTQTMTEAFAFLHLRPNSLAHSPITLDLSRADIPRPRQRLRVLKPRLIELPCLVYDIGPLE